MAQTNPARLPGPERRQQIIEVAREVFLASGLAGARVRSIADRAGINEALLYHYFSSKEELFEAAVVEPLKETIQKMVELERRMADESPADRVDDVNNGLLHLFTTVSELLPLLGMMLFSDQATGKRFYQESFYPVLVQTYEAAEDASPGWLDWPIDPIIPPAVFGMCFGVALDHRFRGVKTTPEEVTSTLTNLLLFGITKGQASASVPKARAAKAKPAPKKRSR
jgi:AcrR family transcriptional regulator